MSGRPRQRDMLVRSYSVSKAAIEQSVSSTVLKTPDAEIDDYLRALAEMAEASGGGITDPPQTVGDCPRGCRCDDSGRTSESASKRRPSSCYVTTLGVFLAGPSW